MRHIFIDTNILIDYTKGYDKELGNLLKLQEKGEVNLHINSVVVAEFFTDKNLGGGSSVRKAKQFINLFTFQELNKEMSMICGMLLKEKQVEYLGDGFIAATCLFRTFELATKNNRYFSKVRDLKII